MRFLGRWHPSLRAPVLRPPKAPPEDALGMGGRGKATASVESRKIEQASLRVVPPQLDAFAERAATSAHTEEVA
jgi:hypothetical protein